MSKNGKLLYHLPKGYNTSEYDMKRGREFMNIKEIAKHVHNAEDSHYLIDRITDDFGEITIKEAYDIQEEVISLKENKGQNITAYKMGLTSRGKMEQMGVNDPIHGKVFDYMEKYDGDTLNFDDYLHPKVEAELVFILKDDVIGTDVTIDEVMECTESIIPGLEIIDSRYKNFKFTLPDVIADNTSAKGVVYGKEKFSPAEHDLRNISVTINSNGEEKIKGTSSAVLGHPAESVATLAKMLHERDGSGLKKGDIIFTGGMTEAILLNRGDDIITEFEGMGEVKFSIR